MRKSQYANGKKTKDFIFLSTFWEGINIRHQNLYCFSEREKFPVYRWKKVLKFLLIIFIIKNS